MLYDFLIYKALVEFSYKKYELSLAGQKERILNKFETSDQDRDANSDSK
jgi:hypothetical protein